MKIRYKLYVRVMKKLMKFLLTIYIILFPSLSWSSELFETLQGNPIGQFFLDLLREIWSFFYQLLSYMIS